MLYALPKTCCSNRQVGDGCFYLKPLFRRQLNKQHSSSALDTTHVYSINTSCPAAQRPAFIVETGRVSGGTRTVANWLTDWWHEDCDWQTGYRNRCYCCRVDELPNYRRWHDDVTVVVHTHTHTHAPRPVFHFPLQTALKRTTHRNNWLLCLLKVCAW